MTDTKTFVAQASTILSDKGLSFDPDVLGPWLTDWRGRYTGKALAMASPASTVQLAALVKLCAAHGVPIVPQGGNTGVCGGATPDESGNQLLLSLRRMKAVRSIDPVNRQVVCEAGVILQDLHNAVAAHDMRFPLTLSSKGSATIGGLISTNAGGNQVLRHGTMRAQVLGLEAVLADGGIYSALAALRKDNRGFDLKQLLIGSEGTLGIITAATLRLLPAVGGRVVLWVGMPSLQAARQLLLHFESHCGGALESFEVLPSRCLESALAYLPGSRAPLARPHAWHAVLELVVDSGDADDLRGTCETMLGQAFQQGLVEDAVIAANEAQAEAFWLIRESIAPAEKARGLALQHDISVPVERMPEFIEAVTPQLEQAWPGCEVVAFGHLGDGNVHLHVTAPAGIEREIWEADTGKAISRQVYDLVTQWGGSISAEHGIGKLKLAEHERLGDPVALGMARKIKLALDPQGLLNPGKLVSVAPGRSSA